MCCTVFSFVYQNLQYSEACGTESNDIPKCEAYYDVGCAILYEVVCEVQFAVKYTVEYTIQFDIMYTIVECKSQCTVQFLGDCTMLQGRLYNIFALYNLK